MADAYEEKKKIDIKRDAAKLGKTNHDAPPGQEMTTGGAGRFILYLLAGLVVFFLLVFAYLHFFRGAVPPSTHPNSEPTSHSMLQPGIKM